MEGRAFDARKAAPAATSVGSAMRRSGFLEAHTFRSSSPTAAFASSVAVGPGDSALTRLRVPFRSSAQRGARLRPQALLALSTQNAGAPVVPAPDPVMMLASPQHHTRTAS